MGDAADHPERRSGACSSAWESAAKRSRGCESGILFCCPAWLPPPSRLRAPFFDVGRSHEERPFPCGDEGVSSGANCPLTPDAWPYPPPRFGGQPPLLCRAGQGDAGVRRNGHEFQSGGSSQTSARIRPRKARNFAGIGAIGADAGRTDSLPILSFASPMWQSLLPPPSSLRFVSLRPSLSTS